MKTSIPITVLLVEDHQIVREGLKSLLNNESDIEVVGEAADGRQAVELAIQLHPQVIIMDIAMPQLNGLIASRQILKSCPGSRILILTAHSDDAYVEQAFSDGVSGYLIKQTASNILSKAIREVHSGRTFVSPSIAARQKRRGARSMNLKGKAATNLAKLTSRELEVLQLIAEGMANKESADKLGISIKTVEKHRSHLMEKLNIHDTAGLTRYAVRTGIIQCPVQLNIH